LNTAFPTDNSDFSTAGIPIARTGYTSDENNRRASVFNEISQNISENSKHSNASSSSTITSTSTAIPSVSNTVMRQYGSGDHQRISGSKRRSMMSDSMHSSETGEDSLGYQDGRMFTLASFRKMANNFWRYCFEDQQDQQDQQHGREELRAKGTAEEIEELYWRIVEVQKVPVYVHYGSDLDVISHGSGFPMDQEELKKASLWNLNLFPKSKGSLLTFLDNTICGVTSPMMYIGMLFSSFCWHTEDNYLYSINYLHYGASKTWYSVPEAFAEAFENVMHMTVPEWFMAHPDLLFLLVTMLSPRLLLQGGVPVFHTVQHEGEFVITFPKAYHAGFSHGFNCAESTNFALDDWFPYGRESVARYRNYHRTSVFSFEKLLFDVALKYYDESLRLRLLEELPLMRATEVRLREKVLVREGVWKSISFDRYYGQSEKIPECSLCGYDCYLSGIVCPCSSEKVVCLHHSQALCSCHPSRKFLLFRYSMEEIDGILKRVGCREPPKGMLSSTLPRRPMASERKLKGLGYRSGSYPLLNSLRNPSPHCNQKPLGKPSRYDSSRMSLSLKKCATNRYGRRRKSVGLSNSFRRKLARKAGLLHLVGVAYNDLENFWRELSYVLEGILEERKDRNGNVEFRLKWQGFPESESTWERAENICCPALIEAFGSKLLPKENQLEFLPKRSPRTTKGKRALLRISA